MYYTYGDEGDGAKCAINLKKKNTINFSIFFFLLFRLRDPDQKRFYTENIGALESYFFFF